MSGEEATEGCFWSRACFFFSRMAERSELTGGAVEVEVEAVGAGLGRAVAVAEGVRDLGGAWMHREVGESTRRGQIRL